MTDYFVVRAKLKGKKNNKFFTATHGSGGSSSMDSGKSFGKLGGTMKFYKESDAKRYAKDLTSFKTEIVRKKLRSKFPRLEFRY